MKKSCRRVRVERPNVPLPYTEFLIPHLGPDGLGLLLNYDIIEFPEEGNPKSSNQVEFPSLKSGRAKWSALQSRKLDN